MENVQITSRRFKGTSKNKKEVKLGGDVPNIINSEIPATLYQTESTRVSIALISGSVCLCVSAFMHLIYSTLLLQNVLVKYKMCQH